MALGLLTGSVTQGSADAFAVASISTGLSGQTKLSFAINSILLELSDVQEKDSGQYEVAICRRTKAAMPNITDPDVIYKFKIFTDFTTSGAIAIDGIKTFEPQGDLLIVEDTIYLCIDSNATTATNTAYMAINYATKTISEVDRLTLLTQSLN